MEITIQLKYVSDPRLYKLFKIYGEDHSFDHFEFLAATPAHFSVIKQEFMKHKSIRDAMIQATSYRSDIDSQLEHVRADFAYFLIDGHMVSNLKFLKFI